MHRAFWDAFQEKITEDPPDYSQAVVLIQEVKEVTILLVTLARSQYCKIIRNLTFVLLLCCSNFILQENYGNIARRVMAI